LSVRVGIASLSDPAVAALIEAHQRELFAITPAGHAFALDVSGLRGDAITLFGAWEGETLAAIGALKRLGNGTAEIKSMRTRSDYLGRGAARAILQAIVELARSEGIERLSLETGTSAAFAPAIALYTSHGFRPGAAFAGYANGPHNQCYHLDLQGAICAGSRSTRS
jgi:putative acetyltransferase